ncbi:hypothetical protein J6590_029846 [Homalodisca vitripennis]|nr:hypothetical protein J6590_029846 [Homalodisca vitripennis]
MSKRTHRSLKCSALSVALQGLNGTPQSEVTPHDVMFFWCVQPAPSNYKTLSHQKLRNVKMIWCFN